MVAFGRPKGDGRRPVFDHRGSYQQWEEADVAPQVVFEIRSPGNTQPELDKKRLFYERYGFEEYHLYNPDENHLNGWIYEGTGLKPIHPMNHWVSPHLSIRFNWTETDLRLYLPDGRSIHHTGSGT